MTSKPIPFVTRLSWLLLETDPLHTRCCESDCVDEYDRIARELADRLQVGEPPGPALRRVLADAFGHDLVARAQLGASLTNSRLSAHDMKGAPCPPSMNG